MPPPLHGASPWDHPRLLVMVGMISDQLLILRLVLVAVRSTCVRKGDEKMMIFMPLLNLINLLLLFCCQAVKILHL